MTLDTGVVGAGIVASNNHLPALSRNPRTALSAVCDVDAEAGLYHFWEERFDRNVVVTLDAVEGLLRNLRRYAREYLEDEFDRHLSESPDGHYLIDRAARAIEAGEQPPREPAESYWTLTLVERAWEAALAERDD